MEQSCGAMAGSSGPREVWIADLVERFREAAVTPEMSVHPGYRSFPHGSCTWASFALGHLLMESEPEADWHLVSARRLDGIGGHDWLESGELAVDVTADQFDFETYIGPTPSPLPSGYAGRQRVELTEWDPPHAEALADIRRLMA